LYSGCGRGHILVFHMQIGQDRLLIDGHLAIIVCLLEILYREKAKEARRDLRSSAEFEY